jgi:rhodanese-related sulfurtransferase
MYSRGGAEIDYLRGEGDELFSIARSRIFWPTRLAHGGLARHRLLIEVTYGRLWRFSVLDILSRLFRRRRVMEPLWIEIGELHRRLTTGTALALIDVRGPDEFNAPPGHLPGAINIPLPELPSRVAEVVARARPIVLVCKTDRRSARAAETLLAAGIPGVAVLRGGTDGWHQQGLPLD